ncbi:hypothetical protein [Singulisphaera acidiphila]|uniref:PEP-CTERM exosortase interaction domain-containing protein n=1 Tax=Singulisphaera acidiphila (strain ATCC BAA-1392 / DSM 18658 / VKM B-2454 / MOB10) TaxID=886293 RepID=L0DHC5_SINAD|nr:hypothetical protein [Singulisphaera acidiphila]AGA28255.1 hypothetical protein Sinac_4032 [Singulisphaera acidiphila DSM 18658]
MRPLSGISIAILVIFAGTSANADSLFNSNPQFTVTDLGTSFSYQYGPDSKSILSVTNGAGNETYAFDKSPVEYSLWTSSGYGLSAVHTYKAGSYQASNSTYTNNAVVTSSVGWTNDKHQFPINDINVNGQVVGSIAGSARFTLPDLQHHVIPSLSDSSGMYAADMLDIYIPPVSGLSWLTSAFQIDDVGRILARGNNEHVYLLSPNPVPEPTPLMMFTTLAAAYGTLSIRRSFRRQA